MPPGAASSLGRATNEPILPSWPAPLLTGCRTAPCTLWAPSSPATRPPAPSSSSTHWRCTQSSSSYWPGAQCIFDLIAAVSCRHCSGPARSHLPHPGQVRMLYISCLYGLFICLAAYLRLVEHYCSGAACNHLSSWLGAQHLVCCLFPTPPYIHCCPPTPLQDLPHTSRTPGEPGGNVHAPAPWRHSSSPPCSSGGLRRCGAWAGSSGSRRGGSSSGRCGRCGSAAGRGCGAAPAPIEVVCSLQPSANH